MPQEKHKARHRPKRRPRFVVFGLIVGVLLALLIGVHWWAAQFVGQAETAVREEKFDAARSLLQQHFRFSFWPSAHAYLLAARTERLLGNFPEADRFLEKSLRLQGDFNDAIRVEGMLLAAETGNMNEATEGQLRKLVKENHADSPQILRVLAKVSIAQWRFHAALEELNQWLTLTPDSGEALETRAGVWHWLEKADQRERDLRQALAVAPHRNTARLTLVHLLLAGTSNLEEITGHVGILLDSNPNQPEYLVAQAQCKMMAAEFDTARGVLDKVLAAAPNHAGAMLTLARLEYQAGQFAAAEEWAKQTIAADPTALQAYQLMGDSLKRQDNPKKVQKADYYLKKYEAGMKDHKRLGALLLQSFETERNNPDVLAEMGTILLRQEQIKAGVLPRTGTGQGSPASTRAPGPGQAL